MSAQPTPTAQTVPSFSAIRLTILDRLVNRIAPKWGLARIRNRAALQTLSEQGFITPASRKMSMRGWQPSANKADVDIIPKLDPLRAASRDLYMNSPIATAAIRRVNTNVVGSGLHLQCRVQRKFLGLTDEQADEWERNTEREFHSWASTPECDATRTQNFYELTGMVQHNVLLSGDVFVTYPFIKREGQLYDLRIKVIEADDCTNPLGVLDTPMLAGGVEVDDDGAPIAYHFRKAPSQFSLDLGPSPVDEWVRVPAYNRMGMRQVHHIYDRERPGQRRGYPFIAPITESLKQITRYSRAEIDAAILNSMFTVFVKHQAPALDPLAQGYVPGGPGAIPGSPGVAITDPNAPDADKVYEIGNGNVVDMEENESIDIADPKHPNLNFDAFYNAVVKHASAALEMPFEILLLHFSKNYSASRAAMNEAWKFFIRRRTFTATKYCAPTYEWWMVEAILRGRITAPGFFDDPAIRAAWLGSIWVGPGRGTIDQLKEMKASREAIDGHLSTYEEEYIKINGGDWEGAMNRRAREEKHLESLGMTSTASSSAQASPSGDDGTDDDTNTDRSNQGDE